MLIISVWSQMFWHNGQWRVASHFDIEPTVRTLERDNFTLFHGKLQELTDMTCSPRLNLCVCEVECAEASGLKIEMLDTDCCYMFERVHPEMRCRCIIFHI